MGFNPRTPCGVRRCNGVACRTDSVFQSTHSLRSATACAMVSANSTRVSIHALLAECDNHQRQTVKSQQCFNPRTPCGVRQSSASNGKESTRFQSTHSLRSATCQAYGLPLYDEVSIHALLAECDRRILSCRFRFPGFNPRTPCGVRPSVSSVHRTALMFQSTHSLRSATCSHCSGLFPVDVSIHALLAECDKQSMTTQRFSTCFNPRTPCGVRPFFVHRYYLTPAVSIHALLAECDGGAVDRRDRRDSFNPRTPCGVRL